MPAETRGHDTRVDDDFGHRYEFRVRVSMEPRFTVDSIDK